jgi:hypothetical protein
MGIKSRNTLLMEINLTLLDREKGCIENGLK